MENENEFFGPAMNASLLVSMKKGLHLLYGEAKDRIKNET